MDSIEQLIEKLERDLTTMNGAQAAATQGLIDSLKRSQRSFGFFDRYLRSASDSAEDFANYIDRGSESADVFSDVLRDSSRREQSRVQQMANAAQNFVQGTLSNIERLGQGSNESASTLQSAAKLSADAISTAMDGIKGIAGAIAPGIGSAIIGVFTETTKTLAQAGSALVGFYAGQMEGLRNQQKKFYEAGIQFSQGIDEAGSMIQNSQLLTLGDLASAAEQARDSLRLMAGGSAGGLKRVTEGFKSLGKTNTEYLYALGYSNDEILSGMADFAAAAERNGRSLSTKELADSSFTYLKNLRELERLTGVSIKEQKNQQEANRRSLFVQNQLAGLGDKERSATTAFLNTVPAALQDIALTGRGMTTESAILASRLPKYAQGIADITARLKSGTIDDVKASEEYRELMNDPKVATEIRENQKLLGNAPAEMYGSLSGIVTSLGELQAQITGNIEQAKASAPDPKDMKGPLQEGINSFVLETKRMENTFQSIALQVTGALQPAIQKMIDGFRDVAETLGIKMPMMLGEIQEGMLLGDKSTLNDTSKLTLGQQQKLGIQKIEPLQTQSGVIGATGTVQIQKDILDEANRLGESYSTVLARKIKEAAEETIFNETRDLTKSVDSLISEFGNLESRTVKRGMTDAQRKRIEFNNRIYDTIESMSNEKLEQLNLQNEGGFSSYLPGGSTFKKLPGRRQGAIVPKNPPVGVIQRMSESGDEAIMPLSKASGGDLGVKVTGGLIDSSMLMKSLLDVTKGQASLIASLNSQMANMNGNFEKLVYEQRQANRLAV